jgi:phage replication initiation protein
MVVKVGQILDTDIESNPQANNMGVQLTGTGDAQIVLDWLAFTVTDTPEHRRNVFATFEVDGPNSGGRYGYEYSAVVLGSGRVLWSDVNPGQGLHVILPSSALAELHTDWRTMLQIVFGNDGWITRIDLAFDDFAGLIDIDLMNHKIELGELTTRFKLKEKRNGKTPIGQRAIFSQTLEMGNRESQSFIRVYDKVIEQGKKGIPTDHETWTRIELESKKERATEIAKRLIETESVKEVAEFCAGLLYGLVDFKVFNAEDTNITRWKTSPWWVEFLGNVAKVRLSLPKIVQTFEGVKRWFSDSIAPMAAVILLGDHGEHVTGYNWLIETVVKGELRFRKRHRILANMA